MLGLFSQEVVEDFQLFRSKGFHVSGREMTDSGTLETRSKVRSTRRNLPRFFPDGGRMVQLARCVAPLALVTGFMLIPELCIQNRFTTDPILSEAVFQSSRFKFPSAAG